MRINLSPAVAAAGVALALAAGLATSAAATTYVGSYTITDNIGNNFLGSQGLVVETLNDMNDPFSFNLTGNNGTTVDLFDIWTNETHLDSDDLVTRGIKVTFTFTQPGNQGGDVNGQTFGVNGAIDNGQVTWNGPLALNFGGTCPDDHLGQRDVQFDPRRYVGPYPVPGLPGCRSRPSCGRDRDVHPDGQGQRAGTGELGDDDHGLRHGRRGAASSPHRGRRLSKTH